MVKELDLTNSDKKIIIDDQDYDFISLFTWYYHTSGCAYTSATVKMRSELLILNNIKNWYLHELVMLNANNLNNGYITKNHSKFKTIHINGNRLDCRRNNIQNVKLSQVYAMRKKPKRINKISSSNYKGVSYNKDKKRYIASICVDKKRIYLGAYKSEVSAAMAYDNAAIKYFGDLAKINLK